MTPKIGRPTKFDDIVGTRPAGHPQAGEPVTVEQRVIDMLIAGNYFETACEAAGIRKQTGHEWVRTGAQAHTKVANGTRLSDLTVKERRCMAFSDSVAAAQSEAEARDVAVLDQLAGGGRKIEVVTRKVNADGETLEETTRTETTEPSAAVLQWRLERRFPDRWGRRRLEISGPDGEPIPIEARAASLAQSLRDYQGDGSGGSVPKGELGDGRADGDSGSDDSGV